MAVSNAIGPVLARSATTRTVTMTETTSTTKMTGLRSRVRGSSLRRLSSAAVRTIGGSNSGRARGALVSTDPVLTGRSVVVGI
jgi:hypothetical protein